jgi:monoamine oxidase
MQRRDVLKAGGTALAGLAASTARAAKKNVIVMGAGIAGLSCAYELNRRGHDVTVLEASGRSGGHVRTFHDPFADGCMPTSALNTSTIRATRNTGAISRNSP